MREIIFRGKRVDTGGWIYGSLVEEPHGNPSIFDHSSVTYSRYEVDPETVGQFTGQLDVHRTKVFENDIVKYSTLPNTISTRELEPGSLTQVYEQLVGVGQVVWLQRYCAFNVTANEPDVFECLDANLAVEVIGNTTDNPELNKEKASAR